MRMNRFVTFGVAMVAAASTAAIVPTTTAQAATNGLSIRTLTKNVVQGDTARVKGKVLSGKAGVSVTIQQRAPQTGKDWGSGRTIKTGKNGKFLLDRQILGKFTRDYRVCLGQPGKRTCSLRARIQVVPRVVGIFNQKFPAVVDAGDAMTVTGSTDAQLPGRVIELQQLNPANLKFYTIGTATVKPDFTFEVTGRPLIMGVKGSTFKLYSAPFAGRSEVTTSSKFTSDVYAYYPLQKYTPVTGGYLPGSPNQVRPDGSVQSFPNAVTPAADNTFTVQLDGQCNRFLGDVFLADTATADDTMNASINTAVGANVMAPVKLFKDLKKGQKVENFDQDLPNPTTLTVTQSAANGTNTDPVWFANPVLACAY